MAKRPTQYNKVEHMKTKSVTETVPRLISRHRRVACLTHGQDGGVVLQELGEHNTEQQHMKIILEDDEDYDTIKADIVQVLEDNEIHVLPFKECPSNLKQERKQPTPPPNHQMRASGGFVLLVILAGVVLLFFLLSPDIEEIFSKHSQHTRITTN